MTERGEYVAPDVSDWKLIDGEWAAVVTVLPENGPTVVFVNDTPVWWQD